MKINTINVTKSRDVALYGSVMKMSSYYLSKPCFGRQRPNKTFSFFTASRFSAQSEISYERFYYYDEGAKRLCLFGLFT